ncbi:MAG: cyanophycinase [Erythrobacter sp. SCN 68-10]|nr:MAG: cyanophycinase [Erythrobacter sp. SCN 68-10]
MIVGGGLSDDNDAVFDAFLGALPATDAPIAIVPAASGYPASSAASFAGALVRRGIAPERIRIVRLAAEDDPETPEDESLWRGNGEDAGEVARLEDVGGIWFTGGDQARITATLLRGDGSESAMLAALRNRFAQGAVIGGTSAGAAIMSDPMIVEGDPLSLLPGAGARRGALVTGRGLGFFAGGLVDQHFGERARLIRLVAALRAVPPERRLGFGIDEDTALVVAPGGAMARVVGRGLVTLVDARSAEYGTGQELAVRGVAIAVLGEGSRFVPGAPLVMPQGAGAAPAECPSVPAAGMAARSESRLVAGLADALAAGVQVTCLVASGEVGLALRFHRAADPADGRLLLDAAPVSLRLAPSLP